MDKVPLTHTTEFKTYAPGEVLKPFVRFFAIQESAGVSTYKVLPDTAPVIGFQYKGRLSYLQGEQESLLSAYGITGIRNSYRYFKNSVETGSVLVFFREGGAAAFFREPLHELSDKSLSLENFFARSELSFIEEQLQAAETDDMKIQLIEAFLISRLLPTAQDPLVQAAIHLIRSSQGDIRISSLAKQLHTSKSPLEKRFRSIVGTSPKQFASIIRLKHVLASYRPDVPFTQMAYDSGYYDQAHFIRQFKLQTGETPDKFFRPGR